MKLFVFRDFNFKKKEKYEIEKEINSNTKFIICNIQIIIFLDCLEASIKKDINVSNLNQQKKSFNYW